MQLLFELADGAKDLADQGSSRRIVPRNASGLSKATNSMPCSFSSACLVSWTIRSRAKRDAVSTKIVLMPLPSNRSSILLEPGRLSIGLAPTPARHRKFQQPCTSMRAFQRPAMETGCCSSENRSMRQADECRWRWTRRGVAIPEWGHAKPMLDLEDGHRASGARSSTG